MLLKKIVAVLSIAILLSAAAPAMGEAATSHTKAVTTAKKYIGVKYLWGGMSPKGFDCSGLVKYSYKKAGKSLPRTAADMYKKGKSVKKSKLKKGDLLFFASNKASKPSHVAIYMGSSKMIHAASSKGVSIASTNNSYWKPKYIGARHI